MKETKLRRSNSYSQTLNDRFKAGRFYCFKKYKTNIIRVIQVYEYSFIKYSFSNSVKVA